MLTPDVSVVMIGVGGLGHMAVEILRVLSGARIIAVDRDEEALKLASDLGADLCLPSDKQSASDIKKATQGLGAMVVLDFVGNDATLAIALQVIRKRLASTRWGSSPLKHHKWVTGTFSLFPFSGSHRSARVA